MTSICLTILYWNVKKRNYHFSLDLLRVFLSHYFQTPRPACNAGYLLKQDSPLVTWLGLMYHILESFLYPYRVYYTAVFRGFRGWQQHLLMFTTNVYQKSRFEKNLYRATKNACYEKIAVKGLNTILCKMHPVACKATFSGNNLK